MAEPNLIELDDAVSRIKQACEDLSPDTPSPFFFMVGAGISYPSVPLACDIVSQCREKARLYGRTEEPHEHNPITDYSHWFQTAYAEPEQRQKYLRGLIEGKPITHANFRLAHLLLNNTISNVVFTTNFDDFLSRALTLFGKPHLICDHPHTVGRINHAKPMVQIVHVHGSYWFYDCCNLRGELDNRALQSTHTTTTMASLLDLILWDRSPLVLGYSGWDGDVFMQALKRRLARPLGTNTYWFCYRRSVLDSIPDEIKHNPNIWFVVPTKEQVFQTDRVEGDVVPETLRPSGGPGESPNAQKDNEPVLSAETVLDKLIRFFELESPELTRDPLGFFAKSLDDALPKSEVSDPQADIYTIRNIIERVRRAKQREDEETTQTPSKPFASQLEQVRDALRRADYREAVKQGAQIEINNLSLKDLEQLTEAMWSAALALSDGSEEELSAYDVIVSIGRKSAALKTEEDPGIKRHIGQALFNKAFRLAEADRIDDAVSLYSEVAERNAKSADLVLREQASKALFNRALILDRNNRKEEAATTYREVVERFEKATETALRTQAAMASVNLGATLRDLNRDEEALAVFDAATQSYADTSDLPLRVQAAMALLNKGIVLTKMKRPEEAVAVYNELDQLYKDIPDVMLKTQVAKGLLNKALVFGDLSQTDAEIEAYSELERRYGEASESLLRGQVAIAMVNKAITLGTHSRGDEALSIYRQVVQRYKDVTEPALQRQVAKAFNGIGFRSIVLAKQLRLQGDESAAGNYLQEAQTNISAALSIEPYEPVTLGNQAYLAFLLGKKDEAKTLLTRAIGIGGENIRQGELADADINRLPEDDEFCELVRSIPSQRENGFSVVT